MTDTIELLEAIGSDASLRYAQVEELKAVLEQTQASDGFTEAVARGDHAPLLKELKLKQTMQVVSVHAPGREDEDEDEDDEDEDDERDPSKQERRQPGKSPSHEPAKPD